MTDKGMIESSGTG